MRQLVMYWMLAMVLASGPVRAQIDPDHDAIGIYFDEAATVVAVDAAAGATVTTYLIATRPSMAANLTWFEAGVYARPHDACMIWGNSPLGINIATNIPGDSQITFLVGCWAPYPPLQEVLVLAILDVHLWSEMSTELFVRGYSYEWPSYRLEGVTDPLNHRWYPSSGALDRPVARINGLAPVTARGATWSAVRAMF
jgi:hypothetical protein